MTGVKGRTLRTSAERWVGVTAAKEAIGKLRRDDEGQKWEMMAAGGMGFSRMEKVGVACS
jgi:hypothetical protein